MHIMQFLCQALSLPSLLFGCIFCEQEELFEVFPIPLEVHAIEKDLGRMVLDARGSGWTNICGTIMLGWKQHKFLPSDWAISCTRDGQTIVRKVIERLHNDMGHGLQGHIGGSIEDLNSQKLAGCMGVRVLGIKYSGHGGKKICKHKSKPHRRWKGLL